MSDALQLVRMEKKKQIGVKINKFKQIYNDLKDRLPEGGEEEFVKNNNLTKLIYEVIEDVIDSGELINWGVLGEVISGKSTVAGHLIDYGNALLIKKKILYFNHIEEKHDKKAVKSFDNYKMMIGDQIEFIRIIKTALWNCFIEIDEFNKLGVTGANSSVEAMLFETYSEVFAQQKVHRISCAPSVINDSNTWLILQVMGKDLEKQITRVRVVYRDIITQTQLAIGHADIHVGETIKEVWYKKYIKKKFNRMKLLQKHGIRKISELETAIIILDIFKELENRAYVMRVDADVVLSISKEVIRRHKYICSIVAESDIVSGARGLLSIKTSLGKLKKQLNTEENKKSPDEEKIKVIKESLVKDEKLLKSMVENYKKLNKIYREYLEIK